MMKQLFALLLLSQACSADLLSQCIPDSTFSGLYFSETGSELPVAKLGEAYEAIIHINVPADTSSPPPLVITVSIDSGLVNNISGLPNGLEYDCDRPRCAYPGGTYGCIRIFGTPTDSSDIGVNDLTVSLFVQSSIIAGSQDIDEFSIELEGEFPTLINDIAGDIRDFYCTQNPVVDGASLVFKSSSSATYSLSIQTIIGELVSQYEGYANAQQSRFDLDQMGLNQGVYLATLLQGDFKKSIRFVVQ